MELILKLPKGKPPFIGVLFEKEYDAESTHATIINNYYKDVYTAILEPKGDRINLMLDSSMYFKTGYTGLKYNSEQLLKFLHITRMHTEFNFSHIVLKGDNHKVVHSIVNRRLWVLKLNKIKLLFEY